MLRGFPPLMKERNKAEVGQNDERQPPLDIHFHKGEKHGHRTLKAPSFIAYSMLYGAKWNVRHLEN
jgi:hypothetical protein